MEGMGWWVVVRTFHVIKLEGRKGHATMAITAYTKHSPFLSSFSINMAYLGANSCPFGGERERSS